VAVETLQPDPPNAALGNGHNWVFHNRCKDTPLNLGNARRRYLKLAAKKAGVHIGGWHDFRHVAKQAAAQRSRSGGAGGCHGA